MRNNKKEIIVYYPNWKLDRENGKISDIPWDKVTMINHAFWKIEHNDEDIKSHMTSFERRAAGLLPRKNFKIVSTNPYGDEIIFKEYAKFHESFPDVRIMISIGGWCCCGYFSEMAYTEAGRKSFTEACVDLMSKHEWIAGIDIDWEYPGGAEWGERGPQEDFNEGCPIWGETNIQQRGDNVSPFQQNASCQDAVNFTKLLKCMREEFDYMFGAGTKLVTACAGAAMTIITHQDWKSASEYLDYINIMTYDMAKDDGGATAHASDLTGTKTAVDYLLGQGVLKSKINIGAPYYGTGFNITEDVNLNTSEGLMAVVGAKSAKECSIVKENLTRTFISDIERKALGKVSISDLIDGQFTDVNGVCGNLSGWHMGYDDKNGGAFLYNDDPESPEHRWFISYDSVKSLEDKIEYIKETDIAGIIVWEITQDSADHELTFTLAKLNA